MPAYVLHPLYLPIGTGILAPYLSFLLLHGQFSKERCFTRAYNIIIIFVYIPIKIPMLTGHSKYIIHASLFMQSRGSLPTWKLVRKGPSE